MLVIRGDTRCADIYLTEFMRLVSLKSILFICRLGCMISFAHHRLAIKFDHFYSRDTHNDAVRGKGGKGGKSARAWGQVVSDESWLRPYFDPTSQLYKERMIFR